MIDYSFYLINTLTRISVFCDFSKSFDKVWYKGLIHKMNSYGIQGKLIKWFENYLFKRRQKVTNKTLGQVSNLSQLGLNDISHLLDQAFSSSRSWLITGFIWSTLWLEYPCCDKATMICYSSGVICLPCGAIFWQTIF
jgi:hypothetical protein